MGRGTLGGVERHVQAILQHLDRERFEPSLAVLLDGGSASDQIAASGVPVHILHGSRGSDPLACVRFLRLLRRVRPHLVHAHELHGASGLALRLMPSIAWVQTEHCAFEHGPSPNKARQLWKAFSGGMTSILTVSRATGNALSRNTGISRERVSTIFNGIDLATLPTKDPHYLRRELNLPEDALLIGAVGRMARQKGWLDFLAVADRLADSLPRAHFVLIGDGPDAASIKKELDRRPWKHRAYCLGARNDAVAAIGGLDFFLFTSLHEELPTTLLEAFALRTPVVGYIPEGGVAEILELSAEAPPAMLLSHRDPDALAAGIHSLRHEPERIARMTDSAAQLLPNFDMSSITRELERVYLRSVGKGSG